jgi:acetyl-CoA carboxylase biotin carboxyl carrier protein
VRSEVRSPIAGSVWTHVASVGQRVEVGAMLLVLEVMKTEFPIESTVAGVVAWLRPCNETIEADDVVVTIDH